MTAKNYVFVRTPLSLFAAYKCLNNKKACLENTEFISTCNLRNSFKFFGKNKDIKKTFIQKVNLFNILKLICKSYRDKVHILIINDLGIYHKLMILMMRYDNLYIVDDGLVSLNRSEASSNRLLKASQTFKTFRGSRNVKYFSLYPQNFFKQEGDFNQNLLDVFDVNNKPLSKNTVFYIDSFPSIDGMNKDDEIAVINYLKDSAFDEKYEKFVFLPHRRNYEVNKKDFKFTRFLPIGYTTFEDFYFNHDFVNCAFVTLYSGAICCVDSIHERYYIKTDFKPIIEKTFFQKIFLKKGFCINTIYDFFKKIGIKELKFQPK